MSAENRALTTIVAKIIEARRDEPRINPQTIATAALLEIDPKNYDPPHTDRPSATRADEKTQRYA